MRSEEQNTGLDARPRRVFNGGLFFCEGQGLFVVDGFDFGCMQGIGGAMEQNGYQNILDSFGGTLLR